MTKTALIAGGGIGGLTVALCLLQKRWSVKLFERADALNEVGAGIQISPNAMKVFRALGLEDAIVRAGFQPEAIELRMGESGLSLLRMPLGQSAQDRWGAPYIHIHRADLMSVLAAALEHRAPNALQLGAQLDMFEQTEGAVTATLSSGDQHKADVLIGADGIHSTVRSKMLGPDQPRFTGNVAWRCVVPVGRLGRDAPDPVAGAWMGRGKHAVTYLLRGGELANLVAVVERDDWSVEGWTEPGDRDEALRDFAGWHPVITRIVEECPIMFRWGLFDRDPLAQWHEGKVVLLGDAAHPMLPFMAQGAAMAIEDAWVLASHLARTANTDIALSAYRSDRFDRTSAIQAASRANAGRFHKKSLLGQIGTYGPMWLAGRVAPGIGRARQDWIYGHDVVESSMVAG